MSDKPHTVIIAGVGTTPEPVVEALRHVPGEGTRALFLVYGRAIGEQKPAPLSLVNTIEHEAEKRGVPVRVFELDEPENLDRAIEFYRSVMTDVIATSAGRIVLDITGGTKVMAGALTYIALSQQWDAEVSFYYTGGKRNNLGRVTEMVVRAHELTAVKELAVKVLDYARKQEFSRALYLAENLPREAKFGFIRQAISVLWQWDAFLYKEASTQLKKCADPAKVLVDDSLCGRLADTIVRLQRASWKIDLTLEALGKLQNGEQPSLSQDAWDGWLYILGDTIANGRRRLAFSPTDSVLRCYRAVEVVTQIALVKLGINPWHPDWDQLTGSQRSNYLSISKSQVLPDKLALQNGHRLLEVMTSSLSPEINRDITNLMSARNMSYLEHGYGKVSQETGQKLLSRTEKIIPEITSRAGIDKNPLELTEELRLEV